MAMAAGVVSDAAVSPNPPASSPSGIPDYLTRHYWWAYVHPNAVKVFERQWLVNLILFGNFGRLRDLAIADLTAGSPRRILQGACVYGDFTLRLTRALPDGCTLDVVDVLPIQIANLRGKLGAAANVRLHQGDASALRFEAASFDLGVLFFLLHETPAPTRAKILSEALRVLRPGGRLIIVDYHRPAAWHPLRYLLSPVLRRLEPFALDLWDREIVDWLPECPDGLHLDRQLYFGGLYQKLVITKS